MDLRQRRDEILQIAAKHGARNLRVFGSVARGDDRAQSDLDLLVDMDPDRSLLDVVGLGVTCRWTERRPGPARTSRAHLLRT